MLTGTELVGNCKPAIAAASNASVHVTPFAPEIVTERVCETPLTAVAVVPFAPPVESNLNVKLFVVPALTVYPKRLNDKLVVDVALGL